jgi:pectate lyase
MIMKGRYFSQQHYAVIFLFAVLFFLFTSCKNQQFNDTDIDTEEEPDEPIPVVPMTPADIFNALKGQKIVTGGWADMANNGAGLSYANPSKFTLIDDAGYPNAENKYRAFINANITNANINSSTGVISGGTVNDNHKFIIISGDIDLSNGRINDDDKSFYDKFNSASPYGRVNGDIILNLGSNTTIIGIDNARIKFGGIRINNKSNIIIRNVTFWDAHGSTEADTQKNSGSKASIDALVIRGTSDGVWVDHCLFTNGTCTDMTRNYNHDGALDIPQGKNITVSWNEFTNYDKVMLVAGNDDLTDVLERQITLHHNYFHYATQRMPRTRGTQMHVYNNYYNDIGVQGNSGYAMGPGRNAHFVVENNFFGSILSGKVVDFYDNAEFPAIVWSSGNNKTVPRSPNDKTDGGKPWEPSYTYTLEPNGGLQNSIPPEAGPKLVFKK